VRLALILPGSIDQLTGGYLFARHIVERLRARGDVVDVIELEGRFPEPDAVAIAAAETALAALPDQSIALIDGLALAAFERCLSRHTQRLKLLGWVHHPLAQETGLSPAQAARFATVEAKLLPQLRGIVCPSRATAAAVSAYGVAPARVAPAPPGTAKPTQIKAREKNSGALHLLTVATVTPRKGHALLIEALAGLKGRAWQLDCIGSLDRDPRCTTQLRAAIAAAGLSDRVSLSGERAPDQLGSAYAAADLFVLPSYHEGYGMAFAEALAHGLPIVATDAGAIPDTVPETAAILVPPGDVAALRRALSELLTDRDRLAHLARGAAIAGAALADWNEATTRWRAEIERLLA
jgi:glycosyltransferase involved in cell wall biosynthesis